MTNIIQKEILSTREAAEYLGIPIETLNVWRFEKKYKLPYIKVDGVLRYRRSGLDNWKRGQPLENEA